jgi:hypothetical protein
MSRLIKKGEVPVPRLARVQYVQIAHQIDNFLLPCILKFHHKNLAAYHSLGTDCVCSTLSQFNSYGSANWPDL